MPGYVKVITDKVPMSNRQPKINYEILQVLLIIAVFNLLSTIRLRNYCCDNN